jgi:peptide/nickel transport system ATP-binding protein
VAQLADRIMVLRYGDLVEEAATREMLETPRQDYTKSLWAVREFRSPAKSAVPVGQTPLTRMSHVTANYGAAIVLDDVSFDIHRGRTTAVVGESGSGKSTAARVIAGLLPPKSGTIEMDGRAIAPDYRSRTRDQLRHTQVIY